LCDLALREVRVVGVGHEVPGEPVSTQEALSVANITCFDERWVQEKLGNDFVFDRF